MSKHSDKVAKSGSAKRGKSQVYNPATGHYLVRDMKTGQFIDVRKDGKAIRGVVVRKTTVRGHPSISKKIGTKAEKAVISIKNKKVSK